MQAVDRALLCWTDVQRTLRFPFCGVTKPGSVRKKGLDKEAWSFSVSHVFKQRFRFLQFLLVVVDNNIDLEA